MGKKTILITGCSSGIGKACAIRLKDLGYRVIASVRRSSDIPSLQALGLETLCLDLSDTNSIQLALEHIHDLCDGKLDALFNNAAYGQPGAIEDVSREALRMQFETNVFGTLELTNGIVPMMRKQGHGHIIFNSSVLGFVSMPFRGAYNASKHALESISDTMRIELESSGIKVASIQPGPISSCFRKNALKKFKANINFNDSSHKKTYENVIARLQSSGEAPFTLGPQAVCDALLKVLNSKRPKPHYYVTKPTFIMGFAKRILTARALERFIKQVCKDDLTIKRPTS